MYGNMYKVLIVEDENMIRRFLLQRTKWSELNCEVVGEAVNGKEGLEKIIELNPDIVITDIRMPILSGLEMLTKAQRVCTFKTIILSAYNDFTYAQTALRLGACEYLLKPINTEQLSDAIKKVCIYLHPPRTVENRFDTRDSFDVLKLEKEKENFSPYVKKMYVYVKNNFREKISIHDLSKRYGVSATYLNRIFKYEIGFPFNDFLNRYRIHISISMLKSGSGYIYEIAEKTGFTDYKYFTEVFRKYIGCAPSDFKSL